MKEQLKQAKDLLQAMIEAKDVPTIEVIHRLCDIANVLDDLKLQEECLVVGDYAMKLARALGSRAVEFQKEAAQTILLIARLNVYKSRACPLFIQAISICDAFVVMDGSDIAKVSLLHALGTAGAHSQPPAALRAQWLGRAVDLISELPSAMVANEYRGFIYLNYGDALGALKVHSKALVAKEQGVAFYRSLNAVTNKGDLSSAVGGNERYKRSLAVALHNYGTTLHAMGRLEDAHNIIQEAVSLYRALAVDGDEQQKRKLADALHNYGIMLHAMGHLEDACDVKQDAVSLYRALALGGNEQHKRKFADALHNHGTTLHAMGRLEDAHNIIQEAVSLYRALAVDGNEQHKRKLADALRHYGITLHAMGHFEDACNVKQDAVSLCRALAVDGNKQHKRKLADALNHYGSTLHAMGHLEDAYNIQQDAVSLCRALAVDGSKQHKRDLADALHNYRGTLHAMGHLKDARSVKQEAISLYRALGVDVNKQHKKVPVLPAPPLIG